MKRITKIIANHFAIENETPEINPNPNTPATMATTKKIIAHVSQPDNPLLFILCLVYAII